MRVNYQQEKEQLYDKLLLEVPDSWLPLVKQCIFEIYDLLESKNMHPDNIQFFQIKEKYYTLRVYYDLPFLTGLTRRNFSDVESIMLSNEIRTKIDDIIDKYDKLIQQTLVEVK
jgi:hypothetical protein